MERTPFLRFDGKQESLAGFRRLFKEQKKESGQGEVSDMAWLVDKLPTEARRIIYGITDPKESWENLYERYGDKELAVITAMQKGLQIMLSFEQITMQTIFVQHFLSFFSSDIFHVDANERICFCF